MPVPRRSRILRAAVASIALAAALAGCTGSPAGGAQDDPDAPVTLTFWHGWSAPAEVAAVDANIARFREAHPHITVKAVPNVTDDKIQQALRAGGSGAPDVVSSFTTDNVGRFCSSGALADLSPFIGKSGIDLAETFPKARLDYTRFDGVRCALPLLGDAYGLYYNKDAFAQAGVAAPPRTWSEFDRVARKLTKHRGDSYERLGFMPVFHGYETTPGHLAAQWQPTYFDADGRSAVATDPAFAAMFTWQKNLVAKLGGFRKLEKYRGTFGDEWGARHPFHTGQVAMQLDGEWRLGMTADAKVPFEVGVAPLPVPDDQAGDYGKGYLSGTIVGIASTSAKQNAAWQLVKYLTTDTDAVVAFADELRNVPSTHAALASPKLRLDPRFRVFLDIARHPRSSTTPASVNGGAYQVTLQEFGYRYESGREPDLRAGLERTAAQIDTDIAKAR